MPTYRIRPGVVPKHLKVPKQPPPAPAGSPHSKIKPPIRKALPNQPSGASKVVPSGSSVDGGSAGTNSASGGFSLQLPRFRASRESWIGRNSAYRDVGKIHPYAKLKDPLSVRVYDWIVRLSVPGLLAYFLFWSEAGEKSDIAILRRWSEGFQQDVKDWWDNVPRDEEVDPQLLLMMEREKRS